MKDDPTEDSSVDGADYQTVLYGKVSPLLEERPVLVDVKVQKSGRMWCVQQGGGETQGFLGDTQRHNKEAWNLIPNTYFH